MLQIQLLGAFHLRHQGQPITTLHAGRLQSLLAYLLLHRGAPQARQQIAFLFWPQTSDAQAQSNLRQLLYTLRHRLPVTEQYIEANERTLHWRPEGSPDAPYTLDVAVFTATIERSRQLEGAAQITVLEEAVAAYAGDLLPACYDDWILPERERLSQMFVKALEQLLFLYEERGKYSAAITHAQRLLRHDPLHEEAYRRLMRLYALTGDRAAALRVYHTCVTMLEQELQVEPSAETRESYDRLLHAESAHAPAVRAINSSLIGREREWRTLHATWRTVSRGAPHLICISGEAGIGKTRLAEEMVRWTQQQGILAVSTRAYAAEGGLAYAPLAECLTAESLQSSLDRLDAIWLSEIARLRPELLARHPHVPRPESHGEHWQRQHLFEALARVFVGENRPLLLVIDDLQWYDSETLEWLHYLLRFDRRARLLVIATLRTEEIDDTHPAARLLLALRSAGQLTEIALAPLDVAATTALANHVAERALDAATAQQLYRATEGNPLFVVETVRASLSDTHASAQAGHPFFDAMPPKVQAAIQTRLAQLSAAARDLARLAAVIGRSFTSDVLAAACEQDEESVVRSLDELWQRRIVREQGANSYDFSHDRIREAAYAEISTARRRLLHRRVAAALERVHAADLGVVSSQLAVHYEQAGVAEQALGYYWQAVEIAEQRFARRDVVTYLRRGLLLFAALPDTAELQQQRLSFSIALGTALGTISGDSQQEVRELFSEAKRLSQQLGQKTQQYIAQRGLWDHYLTRVALPEMHQAASENVQLAQALQIPVFLCDAYYALGLSWFEQGDFVQAEACFASAVEQQLLMDPSMRHSYIVHEPGVPCEFMRAGMLWLLGYPEQARRCEHSAMARASALTDPFSRTVALYHAVFLKQQLGDPQSVQRLAAEMLDLATKYEFFPYTLDGQVYDNWLAAIQHKEPAAIARLRQNLSIYLQTDFYIFLTSYYGLLAEACSAVGQYGEGLAAIDEVFAISQRTGECFWNAELHRLQGELLLAQGAAPNVVAACYLQAREVARRQNARSLELRAVISLARLWQQQGRLAEARQLLADLYSQFTEGFDTPDLRAAQEMLAQLG
jgi:predicted ATPase